MKTNVFIAVLLACGMVSACCNRCRLNLKQTNVDSLPPADRKVLDAGERFVLLSLDPVPSGLRKPSDPVPKETFHEYPVLGKISITNKQERTELLNALYQSIEEFDGGLINCFNPRHGIRATRGNETVDLIICFECSKLHALHAERAGLVFISKSPEPAFSRPLEKAGIPIAK